MARPAVSKIIKNNNFARFRSIDEFFASGGQRGGVFAIGNFDGVHLGHQALLGQALKLAEQYQLKAYVLTFEPHPRAVFSPNQQLHRLTLAREKAQILQFMGFDGVIEQHFTREFANLSAEAFISQYLKNSLGANIIITGQDFAFGQNRQGTSAFLAQRSSELAIESFFIPAICDEGGEVISSSRIRAYLAKGDVIKAAQLLGYRYRFRGKVQYGAQLGRKLGFPTANLALPSQSPLAYGVYAVRVRRQNGQLYDAVASIGVRPTVTDSKIPLLESYLFDFTDDLYGEEISVSFFAYLRKEEKFKDLSLLIAKISQDVKQAQELLANIKALSVLDRALNFTNKI